MLKVGGFQGRKPASRTGLRYISAIDDARRRDRVLWVTPSMFGSQTFARIDSDEFSEWGRMSLRGTMVLDGRNPLRANSRYLTVGWSNTICCANGRTGGWNLFFDSIEDPRHARCYTWDCGRLVFLRWWYFFPLRKTSPFFRYRTRGNSLHQNRQEWKLPLLLCPLFLAVHSSMQKHVNFSFENLPRLY